MKKSYFLMALTLFFLTSIGTVSFVGSIQRPASFKKSDSFFLQEISSLINQGDLTILRSEIDDSGTWNIDMEFGDGLFFEIREENASDIIRMTITESDKRDILVFDQQKQVFYLNERQVTITEIVETTVQSDHKTLSHAAAADGTGPTGWSNNWTSKINIEFGNKISSLTVGAMVIVILSVKGMAATSAGLVADVLGTAAAFDLKDFLSGDALYIKQTKASGIGGALAGFYNRYTNEYYLDSYYKIYKFDYNQAIYYQDRWIGGGNYY